MTKKKALSETKTPGTHWDIGGGLAVLVPYKDPKTLSHQQLLEGFGVVYSEFPGTGIKVVRVNGESLGNDVKKAIGGPAWDRVITTMQLRRAHNERDGFAADNALAKLQGFQKLYEFDPKRFAPTVKDKYDGAVQFALAGEFSKAMSSARVVLWYFAGNPKIAPRLEPGIFCPDLKAALFVRAALGDLRACPCCDQPFVPDRQDQQYCSIPCRETFRKRRQRAKQSKRRK